LLFPTGRQTNRATRAATAAGKQQQGGGESPLGLVHLVNISEKLAKYFKRCMFVLRLSTPTSPPFWGLGGVRWGFRCGGRYIICEVFGACAFYLFI